MPTQSPHALQDLLDQPQRIGVSYEPVVDLRGATVRGYDARARVGDDTHAPRRWFDEAAAAGHAGVLEAQVVQASLVARPLLAAGRFLGVALSAPALLSDPVQEAFRAAPALDHVVVSLDARSAGEDLTAVQAAVEVLRAAGAQLALDLADDGIDGFDRVAQLRPQYVRVAGDPAQIQPAFEALADLALEPDPRLIATGVDGDEQLGALLACGVRFAQGDALGRALPAPGELAKSLRAHLLRRVPEDLGSLAEPGMAVGASALCLDAATTVKEAARQAMARPPAVRFDPIAVVAVDGSHAGVVPIDRLVSALAG